MRWCGLFLSRPFLRCWCRHSLRFRCFSGRFRMCRRSWRGLGRLRLVDSVQSSGFGNGGATGGATGGTVFVASAVEGVFTPFSLSLTLVASRLSLALFDTLTRFPNTGTLTGSFLAPRSFSNLRRRRKPLLPPPTGKAGICDWPGRRGDWPGRCGSAGGFGLGARPGNCGSCGRCGIGDCPGSPGDWPGRWGSCGRCGRCRPGSGV